MIATMSVAVEPPRCSRGPRLFYIFACSPGNKTPRAGGKKEKIILCGERGFWDVQENGTENPKSLPILSNAIQ